jgi:hypothetical protein
MPVDSRPAIIDQAGQFRGGPYQVHPDGIPWLWPNTALGQRVSWQNWPPYCEEQSAPEHTPLNDGPPPARVPHLFSFRTLRYNAGLRQWGMTQHFDEAYLPPPVVVTSAAMRNRVGARSVGGVLGAGTISAATRHIPSTFVPRTIT